MEPARWEKVNLRDIEPGTDAATGLPTAETLVVERRGIVSVREITGMLSLSREKVIALIEQGDLTAKKLNGVYLVRAASVHDYLVTHHLPLPTV